MVDLRKLEAAAYMHCNSSFSFRNGFLITSWN